MSEPYIGMCTEGCSVRAGTDGEFFIPRKLTALDIWAHEDVHLSPKVRVLVRMLRDASPEVREAVLAYWAGPLPKFAKVWD